MIKDASLKVKFEMLKPWMDGIFADIKRDIKNEHLRNNRVLVQRYFPKKAIEKAKLEEIAAAYYTEIVECGNEDVASYVISRWILRHGEIYEYFAGRLSAINPKFDEIELLDHEQASKLLSSALQQFGADRTYIFCVINSVALADEAFVKLRELALEGLKQKDVSDIKMAQDLPSVENLQKFHEEEMLKLADKYEKRLQGVTRKYTQDVEGLKKQIGQLQKRIGELNGRR